MRRPLAWSLLFIVLSAFLLTGLLLHRLATARRQSPAVAAAQVLREVRDRLLAGRRDGNTPPVAAPRATGKQDRVDRIAFIDARGQVVTASPEGGDLRRLTSPGRRFALPTWSPDGKSLAFLGASDRDAGVYLMADEAGGPVEAWPADGSGDPFYLYWSPEGDRMGYLIGEDDGVGLRVRRRGESPGPALVKSAALYWDWQADGRSLLVHGLDDQGGGSLAWLNLPAFGAPPKAEAADLRTFSTDPSGFQAPAISFGNRYLAYGTRSRPGESYLTIADRGRYADPVRIPYRGRTAMAWNPRSETLAFISPPVEAPTFAGSLRVVDMPEGTVRHLANAAVLGFFWSPDGRRIACFTVGIPAREETIQAAFVQGRPVIPLELWVVDVASGRSRRLLRFVPTRSFAEQVLPFFDQVARSHRIWSPDSRRLVIAAMDPAAGPGILVLDASDAAGGPRRVAAGSIAFWSPR